MSVFGRSKVRDRLLTEFFSKPGTNGHVRELARRIGASPATVGSELGALERLGILRSQRVGRSRVYFIDERSTIVPELRAVVQKTIGVEALLVRALAGLDGVESAYIFGSYASGTDRAHSDVDVLLIGRPDRVALSARLSGVETSLGRDVNVLVRTPDDLREKREDDPFWQRVLNGPLIHIAGERLTL